MIWYILICSMIGGLSVSVTTGLGSAIVTSVKGDNQVRVLGPMESIYEPYPASNSLSIGSLIFCSSSLQSLCVSHFAKPRGMNSSSQILISYGNLLSQRRVGVV